MYIPLHKKRGAKKVKKNINFSNIDSLPPLFNFNKNWFKFDNYQIMDPINYGADGIDLFIKPGLGAKLEWYNPFEKFPNILRDFFDLLNSIDDINNKYGIPKDNQTAKDKSMSIAKAFLFFTEKYGLMGNFWDGINNISPEGTMNNEKLFVYTNMGASQSINSGKPRLEYNNYARRFFPNTYNFPKPWEQEKFFRNYAEMPGRILTNVTIGDIKNHYDNWKDGNNKNISLTNSKFGIGAINNNGWGLDWPNNSLINSLAIMYILNLTNNMGENRIKICKKCNKPFPVGPRGRKVGSECCSKKCQNAAGTNRYRERKKKAKKMHEEEASIEEIYIALNKKSSKKTIKGWIKQE